MVPWIGILVGGEPWSREGLHLVHLDEGKSGTDWDSSGWGPFLHGSPVDGKLHKDRFRRPFLIMKIHGK